MEYNVTLFKFLRVSSVIGLVVFGAIACGGGGGGEAPPESSPVGETPIPSTPIPSTPAPGTPTPVPIKPTETPAPTEAPVLTVTLGAPTMNPVVVPPTGSASSVRISTVVRGTVKPSYVAIDEVDADGNVIRPGVTQLYDDGEGEDLIRGDQNYSGHLSVSSASASQRYYRVTYDLLGELITSSPGTLWISGCPAVARPSNPEKVVVDADSGVSYFADEVSVVLEKGVPPELSTINAIVADTAGPESQVVGCIPSLNQYLIEIPNNQTLADLNKSLSDLEGHENVVSASPNAQVIASPKLTAETCDGQECQWYLERIRAPEAWAIGGAGDEQIGVAVLDFGVDCSHPELDCDASQSSEDIIDHGTGVASLIGAKNNDGTDLVGVAWNTKLYPLSFLAEGGSQYKLSELITLSMSQENVRVINISAATFLDPGFQLRDAMCSAIDSGRLIVAAAGNAAQSADCRITRIFPAQYNAPGNENAICSNGADLASGLIVVGATDENNQLAEWDESAQCSNVEYVDIYAPGEDLYTASADQSSLYTSSNGTSFATPLAAGGAAVVWAADPSLSVNELHDRIVQEATILDDDADTTLARTEDPRMEGMPLLNLYGALGGEETAGSQSPENLDLSPDPFSFRDVDDALLSRYVTSNIIEVNGIDQAVPIDVVGGDYAINGGEYTSAAGMARLNDEITVQVKSGSTPQSLRQATLFIGDQQSTFNVRTIEPVPEPDNFDFINVGNAPLDSLVVSASIQINNLPADTPIRVSPGGEYSLQGVDGPFTNENGFANSSDSIVLRVRSANTHSTRETISVTIGEQTDSFSVTTERLDNSPENLSFDASEGEAINSFVFSEEILVEGINAEVDVSISRGMISIDGEGFSSEGGTVSAGQTIQIRHLSANTFGTNAYSTLAVGSQITTFRSRTIENDAPIISDLALSNQDSASLSETYVGDTLTFSYTYSDADGDLENTPIIQWLRNRNEITENGNSNSYTIIPEDSGTDISVRITPVAATGRSLGVAVEADSVEILNSAPVISNLRIIDSNGGSIVLNDTLTVLYDFSDADGDTEGLPTYQWRRNGEAISVEEGGDQAFYIISEADVDQIITVDVTPEATSGAAAASASASPSVVVGNQPPEFTNVALIDSQGIPIQQRNPVSVFTEEEISITYVYQDTENDPEGAHIVTWLRDGVPIENATSTFYEITQADSGSTISASIIPVAQSGSLQGNEGITEGVAVNAVPVVSNANVIAFEDENATALTEVSVGDVLSVNYDFTDAEDDQEGSTLIQWLRNGEPISPNGNANSYVVSAEDVAATLGYRVNPLAATGSAQGASVLSSTVLVLNSAPSVNGLAIENTTSEGSPNVNDILEVTYTYSDIEGDLEGATSFQWFNASDELIGSGVQYQISLDDLGQILRAEVTPRASSGTVLGEAVSVQISVANNSAPSVTGVSVVDENGMAVSLPTVNSTVFGSYTFQDVDGDQEGVSVYRWLRNGVAITGANAASYQLQLEDSGTGIQFEVTPVAATGVGSGETITSAIVSIGNSAPTATNLNVVDGNGGAAEIGDTLTGTYTYSDVDGDAQGETSFAWLRNGTTLVGSEQTYVVTPEDNGQQLQFTVTPMAQTGSLEGEAVVSAEVQIVLNAAPEATSLQIIDEETDPVFSAAVGRELFIRYTYSDAEDDTENTAGSVITWLRDDVVIAGETGLSYTVQIGDSGTNIRFSITPAATTGFPTGETVTSPAVTIRNSAPSVDPDSITLTDTSGAPLLVGDTLNVSYEYTDRDGDEEGNTVFQWLRNGVNISGATENSYNIEALDSNQEISVSITPIAATGEPAGPTVTSSNILVGNTAPSISELEINAVEGGVYVVGETLSVSYIYDDLEEDPEGATRYQWLRNGEEILVNGSSSTYLVANEDAGTNLSVIVTPVAASGTQEGDDVPATAVSINGLPWVHTISFSDSTGGSLVVGDILGTTYTGTDIEEPQNVSIAAQWIRIGNEGEEDLDIPGATSAANYVVVAEDSGHELVLRLTPSASTGSSPGIPVLTSAGVVQNSAPEVTSVEIQDDDGGTIEIDDQLTGIYTIEDPDNDPINTVATSFRWLRGTTVVGTDSTYTVGESDNGQTLVFEVTPVASEGVINGEPVESALLNIPFNNPPEASDVEITHDREGAPLEGDTLTGSYTFSDAEDEEGSSQIRWLRNGTVIVDENNLPFDALTYTLQSADVGTQITFRVTPIAATGMSTGSAVSSASVTPIAIDTAPNAITITSIENADPGSTENYSANFTLVGFNSTAAVSVSGGFYQINQEGSFVNTDGVLDPGQSLTLQITSSETLGETNSMTLTVGGVEYTFSVTTTTQDRVPESFSFNSRLAQPLNTPVESNIVEITGISDGVAISVVGGEYSINGGSYQATASQINNGSTVQLIADTSGSPSTDVVVALTIGAVTETFTLTTVAPEATAPTGGVVFPVDNSVTEGHTITVRGRASDISGIREVTVNGRPATTENQFLDWQVIVPIVYGMNELAVNIVDQQGNQFPQTLSITRSLMGDQIAAYDFDEANQRFIAIAAGVSPNAIDNKLYSIDRETGETRVISDDLTPDSENRLLQPRTLVVNSAGTEAIVIDQNGGVDVIRRVNLTTGERTVITEDTEADPEASFKNIYLLALDRVGRRLFVADATQGVIEINLDTGESRLLLSLGSSNLFQALGLYFDTETNSLFVHGFQRAVSIDLTTGIETLITSSLGSDDTGIIYFDGDIYFKRGRREISVIAFNVDSGEQRVLSDNTIAVEESDIQFTENSGSTHVYMALDPIGRRLFLRNGTDIISVEIDTGIRRLIATNVPTIYGVDYDVESQRIFGVARYRQAIVSIDVNRGAVTLIADESNPVEGSVARFSDPWSIAYDPTTQQFYVSDWDSDMILRVDEQSEIKTILSDNSRLPAEEPFMAPDSFEWDETRNMIMVLDSQRRSIISVNLESGSRELFSTLHLPDQQNGFIQPVDITFDAQRDLYLILDSVREDIMSVDVATGAREIFRDIPDGSQRNSDNNLIHIPSSDDVLISNFHNGVFRVDAAGGSEGMAYSGGRYTHDVVWEEGTSSFFSRVSESGAGIRNIFQYNETQEIFEKIPTSPTQQSVVVNDLSDIVMSSDRQYIYIADRGAQSIYRWNIQTQETIIVASNAMAQENSNYELDSPDLIELDDDAGRLLVVGGVNRAVVSVDINSGTRTVVTDNSMVVEESETTLGYVIGAAFIEEASVLYVTDNLQRVISVDLTTGVRSIIAANDRATETSDVSFSAVQDVIFDSVRNRLLVADSNRGIISVDIESGARTLLLSPERSGINNNFDMERISMFGSEDQMLICTSRTYSFCYIYNFTEDSVRYVLSASVNGFSYGQRGRSIVDTSGEFAYFVNKQKGNITIKDLVNGYYVVVFK